MALIPTLIRTTALTAPKPREDIILPRESASSSGEVLTSFHHGASAHRIFLSLASTASFEMVQADIIQALQQRAQLDRRRIEALEREVAKLQDAIAVDRPAPRKLSKAQAKKEIRAYFAEHDGEVIYPDDIADGLNLDLLQVIEVCEVLAKEGRIAREG